MYPNQGGYPPQQQMPPYGVNMPPLPNQQPQGGWNLPQQQTGANIPPSGPQMPYPQAQGMPSYQQGVPYGGNPQQPTYPQNPSTYPSVPNTIPQQGYPGGAPNNFTGAAPNTYPVSTPNTYPGGASNTFQPQGYPAGSVPPQGYPQGSVPPQNNYAQQPQQAQVMPSGRPTVVAHPNFDASTDAAALRKAMKGFGTDEATLINVLCRRTNAQRLEIAKYFKTAYGKDLIADIKSETSGNFEKVLVALLTPTLKFYCEQLHTAMEGLGTDEGTLIEIMCTMRNQDVRNLTEMYKRLYGKNLEEELRSETSGYFKRLLTSLSAGGRDESNVTNIEQARTDAQALKTAGVDKFGTDEAEFIRVLCTRNFEQLKVISAEYAKIAGNTLEKDIKKEFSGDIKEGLLAILYASNSLAEFFARRLHKSMVGLGTNDRSLIRLCVTRCEVDMVDIKEAFQRVYAQTLQSFIKGDTSGHYRKALYVLCGEQI